jgi:hypothetical protein
MQKRRQKKTGAANEKSSAILAAIAAPFSPFGFAMHFLYVAVSFYVWVLNCG